MKKITLTSDEWQSLVEALNFAIIRHEERITYYRESKDELSARALERMKARYLDVREKIVEQTT